MPWKETCVMNEKVNLIEDWLSGRWRKSQLANKYRVSRPTIDKWINRFKQFGYSGLEELSRRPENSPNETPLWQQQLIVETKRRFQHWGPKKVRDYLGAQYPDESWPADSTCGSILQRYGWVKPRTRRKRVSVYPSHLTESKYPGHVWNVDFKGDVRLGNRERCYPFTLSDDFSRYLLCCNGVSSTAREPVKQLLKRAFCEFGQPEVIKSDNGVPFASRSLGGLSRLSIWLIKHGIVPERIDKGKPTQNGRHERMHRTLKEEAMSPPKSNMAAQQRAFDKFRYEYNELRAHESLERKPPATVFTSSKVNYQEREQRIEYDFDKDVRKVRTTGEIKWKGHLIYLSELLRGEPVGIKDVGTGFYEIYYSFLHIGYLNEKQMRIEKIKSRT